MNYNSKTKGFNFCYMESTIKSDMLIENHCHSEFEMLAVLNGDIRIIIEGKSLNLTSGDAIIIPPLLYHTISSNKKGSYRRFTVIFDISAIPAPLKEYIYEKENLNAPFSWHRFGEIAEILKMGKEYYYAPLLESLMTEIFYSYSEKKSVINESKYDDTLEKVIAYIDEHLYEKILLEDIAKNAACSKSLVSHLFKSKMKIPVKQYIIKKKLAIFDILIRKGMSPTDASARLGYEHYSDFYRIRKKYLSKDLSEK